MNPHDIVMLWFNVTNIRHVHDYNFPMSFIFPDHKTLGRHEDTLTIYFFSLFVVGLLAKRLSFKSLN